MKNFLLPVLLAIIIAGGSLGCDKQNALLAASENLSGKWNWESTDGGIAYNIHNTPASTGNTRQLEFKAENTYTFYLNGAVESKGTYQITREKSIADGTDKNVINFSADRKLMILSLTSNSLLVTDNNFDGTTSLYSQSGK